jgi:cysteinyl-tRNA synthetase
VNSIVASVRERGADVQIQGNGSLTFSALSEDSQNFERHVKSLIEERDAARGRKDWKESDRIRDELKAMGIDLEDKKDGTTTWKVRR